MELKRANEQFQTVRLQIVRLRRSINSPIAITGRRCCCCCSCDRRIAHST